MPRSPVTSTLAGALRRARDLLAQLAHRRARRRRARRPRPAARAAPRPRPRRGSRRSALSITMSSASVESGFSRKSSAPSRVARTAASMVAWPLIMTTGDLVLAARGSARAAPRRRRRGAATSKRHEVVAALRELLLGDRDAAGDVDGVALERERLLQRGENRRFVVDDEDVRSRRSSPLHARRRYHRPGRLLRWGARMSGGGAQQAKGTLGGTPISNLLVYALDCRLTGTLVIEDPEKQKSAISFRRGIPSKVKLGPLVAPLSELAVTAGVLDEAKAESTFEQSRAEKRLHGDVLESEGLVEPSVLADLLVEQVAKKVEWLCGLVPESLFGYYDGQDFLQGYGGAESSRRCAARDLASGTHSGLRRRGGRDARASRRKRGAPSSALARESIRLLAAGTRHRRRLAGEAAAAAESGANGAPAGARAEEGALRAGHHAASQFRQRSVAHRRRGHVHPARARRIQSSESHGEHPLAGPGGGFRAEAGCARGKSAAASRAAPTESIAGGRGDAPRDPRARRARRFAELLPDPRGGPGRADGDDPIGVLPARQAVAPDDWARR